MIYINRTKARIPDILLSRRAGVARKAAAEFFDGDRSKRTQERHPFQEDLWLKAADSLHKLFKGKCAYCEKRFSKTEVPVVDHFRPTSNAKQFGGMSAPDHYWWLAYQYDNLYLSCGDCHRNKATLFPVTGKRADKEQAGEDLRKERALLLDPCHDDPQEYFYFWSDGRIVPAGKGRDEKARAKRAETTIDVFGLNRKELVKARAAAMREAEMACVRLEGRSRRVLAGTGASMSHPAARVSRAVASWLPFAAARRQAAREVLRSMGGYGEQIISLVPELASTRAGRSEAYLQPSRKRKRRTAYIRELQIGNFKTIRRLALTFGDPTPDGTADWKLTGWRVFVGENGSGKSSVLQALTLALAGEYQVRRILIKWDKILRRPRGKRKRPREGFVKVLLSTGDLIELRFNKRRAWFKSGAEGALTMLRAYGPTRNLPNTRVPASWASVESMIRIVNLLDPYSPLCSADGWIAGLSKDRFEVVALALKDLLQLDRADRIRRERRWDRESDRYLLVPIVDIGNSSNRLDELSDGYQSMIALAVEIMAGLPKKSTDFQTDTGIVVIDELGNHLHPSWRMQVVASLRRTFPRIQFVVTTHDPLCLRGLEIGEIAVLRREGVGVTAQIVTESVAHLRADQLLTSPLFGLPGTRDPELVRASRTDENRYDELFLKTNRTPSEESEFQSLRAAIVMRTAEGETPTERFIEKAVRQALTELTKTPPPTSDFQKRPAPEEIRAALKAKFVELLK